MKHEEYVTYQQAVALKERGFDWPCNRYYSKADAADNEVWLTLSGTANWNADDAIPFGKPICSAPTQALAQKWLREDKGWHIEVRINGTRSMYGVELWETKANGQYKRLTHADGHARLFDAYEAALSAGIDAAIGTILPRP